MPASRAPGESLAGSLRLRIYLVLTLVATVYLGARHDYVHFVDQWRWVLAGHDPWSFPEPFVNAYGPLFAALAGVAAAQVLAPKVLFTVVWILFGLWLRGYWRERTGEAPGRLWILYWMANPYFLVEVVHNGHFDVVVGACAALAVAWRDERPARAGGLLAVGILLKFLPVLLLPFLVWERGRLRWRLAIACAATTAAGCALAMAAWGASWIRPLLFAGSRPPSQMSIFVLLDGPLSPLRPLGVTHTGGASLPLMAAAAALVLAAHVTRRWSAEKSCLLALTVVLALYKVGHPQFYAVVLALLPLWLTDRPRPWSRRLRRGVGAYVVWISLYTLFYKWTGGYGHGPWLVLREGGAGVAHLVFTAWLATVVLAAPDPPSSNRMTD